MAERVPKILRVEQRAVIKFLVKEETKTSEIIRRLQNVYHEGALYRSQVYDLAQQFLQGRESIEDEERTGRPAEATDNGVVEAVERLLEEDRRVTVDYVAQHVGISHGSAHSILVEHLGMAKVSARWVPKLLSEVQMQSRVDISTANLTRFDAEGWDFLRRVVTGDECWVHHYDPETKRQSMSWKRPDSPTPVKARALPSAGKVMAIIFWDCKGVILTHFVPKARTVNGEYYSDLLINELRPAILEKRRGLQNRGIILHHDNAPSHTANITLNTIRQLHWEILAHPAYSPDLAPCDYYLFADMKNYLRGKRFPNNSAVGSSIYQWLQTHDEEWFANGMRKLTERWGKCIDVRGNYLEKVDRDAIE